MSLIAKEAGQDFDQIEAGTYLARCYGVVDIGTQVNDLYGGFDRKIVIQFEFPTELIDAVGTDFHGQPYGLGKFYTLSLSSKAHLRHDLESWRSRAFTPAELEGFDIKTIISAPCFVSVIRNDKGKSVIATVSALPKGTICPPQINPVRWFDTSDMIGFEELSGGFKKLVQASTEFKGQTVDMQGAPSGEPPLGQGACTKDSGNGLCNCEDCSIPF
jgi:hypothetical protein